MALVFWLLFCVLPMFADCAEVITRHDHGATARHDPEVGEKVEMDQVTARMSLMEAELNDLKQEKTVMKSELTILKQEKQMLALRLDEMEVKQANDKAAFSKMVQGAKPPLVGFNAQATIDQYLSHPDHVKFNNVLYNAGQGYDNSTGDFTATVSGVYFFIFHTRGGKPYYADSFMMVNGQEVCRAYIDTNWDHGSCHAVVRLTKGDKVWIEPHAGGTKYYTPYGTSFAGFLFHADP